MIYLKQMPKKLILIVCVVLLVLFLLLRSCGGAEHPRSLKPSNLPTTPQTKPKKPSSPQEQSTTTVEKGETREPGFKESGPGPFTDPQERNPETSARIRREVERTPAFQKLPYSNNNILVDYTGAQVGKRIVLSVGYQGSKKQAKVDTLAFIRNSGDTSSHYVIHYYFKGEGAPNQLASNPQAPWVDAPGINLGTGGK